MWGCQDGIVVEGCGACPRESGVEEEEIGEGFDGYGELDGVNEGLGRWGKGGRGGEI